MPGGFLIVLGINVVWTSLLTVNKAFIDRMITILPMLKGSGRDIRLSLDLILGARRSVGYISETLAASGEQAMAYHLRVTVRLPILGEADEIFQGRKPCLTLVDGRSFLVVSLTPAESRDATTLRLRSGQALGRHLPGCGGARHPLPGPFGKLRASSGL
jgi:hypothetical protein